MNEEQKKQIAIFRFGVISDFVAPARLSRGERERLLKEKCARQWRIPFSHRTHLSRTTILSWIRDYEKGGRRLEALGPKDRSDRGSSRALDSDTAAALCALRQKMPHAPIHALIARARAEGAVDPFAVLAHSTVYRFLHRQGLMHPLAAPPIDRRRFEAELPNDIWQSDAMHGPSVLVEGKRKKCFLFAFLDDMSRLVTHARFYANESLDTYLLALQGALLARGLPRKLYVDNGPAFRSLHLREITASLGIALVHSRPYQPEGRGKCERWFRTVRADFLASFTGDTIEELNEGLLAWIRNVYHVRPHRSTGEAPINRFASRSECLRPAPQDLLDHFRKCARRRVAKDRTVALGGRIYEAPVPLIGKQVTLLYHEQDPARVEARCEGRSHGMLRIVDPNVNCRVRRQQDSLALLTEPRPIQGGRLTFSKSTEN